MAGRYSEIKTQYVRRKLRATPWEYRNYIDSLVELEKWAIDGSGGSVATAVHRSYLASQYPVEFVAIQAEIETGKVMTDLEATRAWADLNASAHSTVVPFDSQDGKDFQSWKENGGRP